MSNLTFEIFVVHEYFQRDPVQETHILLVKRINFVYRTGILVKIWMVLFKSVLIQFQEVKCLNLFSTLLTSFESMNSMMKQLIED